MHFGNRAMLPEAKDSNEGNDIQAKFAMWQRPTSFFFGMRAHMIARTRGGVALTDGYPELEDSLQGDHLPPRVVRDPQGAAALGTGPLKWPQGGRELCFGFGRSS